LTLKKKILSLSHVDIKYALFVHLQVNDVLLQLKLMLVETRGKRNGDGDKETKDAGAEI